MATYPTNPPGNTLQDIQTKVRRLTRSPSEAQLTTDDLNNYINTFILYDFPELLRTFNYKQQFTFYTNSFQDVYPTDIIGFGNAANAKVQPLYNFINNYLTVNPPVYIAGYQSLYTQSREQFFGIYPIVNSIANIGKIGDGMTTMFSGFVNVNGAIIGSGTVQKICLIKNEVMFSSTDLNGNGTSLIDSPILDSITGNPTIWGILYDPQNAPVLPILCAPPYNSVVINPQFAPYINNFINYITGQYSITFSKAPAPLAVINSQSCPQNVALPQALMFYEDHFIVRPIPDQPYRVNFEVFVRPTRLLETDSVPGLEEYWQYISYGAAVKIFQDRMDLDSVQMIMPEFKLQERLCLRRTIVQITNERTATIYTEQTSMGQNNGWGQGGGQF
jgi:hypothetical protein